MKAYVIYVSLPSKMYHTGSNEIYLITIDNQGFEHDKNTF